MSARVDPGDEHLGRSVTAGGPVAAFEEVVGPLIEPGYRLALAVLGREADAHDAIQDATLRAWRKFGQLHDRSKSLAWFMSIVVNRCRTVRRRRWWNVLELTGQMSSPDSQRDWARSSLRQAIAELPAGDQAALFLFSYVDLPVGEVASALRVSPAAAKSRIYRAVRRLEPRVDPLEVT
jgi:RNA polymerase sigma-70 factor (ECF subfamily)